ncbi:30S ribosomal protein S4 [Candidatus Uhrbacteria bacterium]|nr:30S ribosomal protein S4 [Candidatus Uhrbacteria bacterium]
MAKTFEQCHVCRRAGVKLYLKGERCYTPKCAIVRRNYPPGVQGAKKGKPRLTSYGQQLREKQKARMYYGISEKQLRNYFDKASRKLGNTGDILFGLLEMRLDNVLQRLGWTASHRFARQTVSHGHVLVDGKRVTIPSFQVKQGHIITLSSKASSSKNFQTVLPSLEKVQIPGWLFSEKGEFQGKIVGVPSLADNQPLYDMKFIIEFYSR